MSLAPRPPRFDQLSALLVGVFVLVALGPALLGQGTLVDVDLLTLFQPFSAHDARPATDAITCRGDTVDYLPGVAATKQALLHGDLATWSPYEVGGSPLAHLPNHGVFSPLALPYLVLPLWLAPAFVKLGEIAVGIAGMFAFLRRRGVRRGPALLAGVVFVSSGFMMMWTNWPHTRVAALIPALFWALERLVQDRRVRDVVLVAVVVASMLLGGFPAVTLFALTAAAPYVVMRVAPSVRDAPRRAAGVLLGAAGGVGLGVALAAVQLVPFARNLDAVALEERDWSGVHSPLGLLLTAVAPESVGLCVAGESYGPVNPIEGVAFLGAAAAVLAVCALVVARRGTHASDRSATLFLAVLLGVVLVAVWFGGPLLSALQSLPFYSSNSINRARSVFAFAGAALAGHGLDRLLDWASPDDHSGGSRPEQHRRRRDLAAGLAVVAAVLLLGGLVLRAALADAAAEGYGDHLRSSLVVPGVLLAVSVAAAVLTRFGPDRARSVGPVVLALLLVGQSAWFAHTMLPRSERSSFYPTTATHAFLQEHLGAERYAAGDRTMYPATSDWYALRTPVGHEFTAPRWRELLEALDPDVARSPTNMAFSPEVTARVAAGSSVLDQLSVRYWVAETREVAGTPVALVPGSGEPVVLDGRSRLECTVPGGAMRGVQVRLTDTLRIPQDARLQLHVAVRTPSGVREGTRPLRGAVRAGALRVGVAGEDLADRTPYVVDVWTSGHDATLVLEGAGTGPACSAVRPAPDGLRLVHADAGGLVLERTSALPRIRWAAHSEVVPDAEERLERLAIGLPDDTVLLEDPALPVAEGASAEVTVLVDEAEQIRARVKASGDGYLVVADSILRDGWTATVDGEPVAMVAGNHAFAAIPVPHGEHDVRIRHRPPGLRTGALVSAGALGAAVGLLLLPVLRRPLRRRIRARLDPPEETHRHPRGRP
ncbi:DUF6541 family protein [Nocardioides pacificus]